MQNTNTRPFEKYSRYSLQQNLMTRKASQIISRTEGRTHGRASHK